MERSVLRFGRRVPVVGHRLWAQAPSPTAQIRGMRCGSPVCVAAGNGGSVYYGHKADPDILQPPSVSSHTDNPQGVYMLSTKSARIVLLATFSVTVAVLGACQERSVEAVAVVEGETITRSDLDKELAAVKSQYAASGQPLSDEQLAQYEGEVLENLITKTALLAYATERNVSTSSEEIQEEIDRIAEQFGSEEGFIEALEAQGFTEESFREELEVGMTIDTLINKEVLSEYDVSDEEIADFYESNMQYFQTEESVTARHILVTVEEDATEEDKAKAREKIEGILQELEGGADFAELAREKSEGPSAESGGNLGKFSRGQMVAPFEEAAFQLEPGQMSGIVETQFGFHVILVSDRSEASVQSLEEVSEEIANHLRRQQDDGGVQSFIDEVRQAADVKIMLESVE